jgi:hypothetical protein
VDACANIGEGGVRSRLATGVVGLVVGVGLSAALVAAGVARPVRLVVLLPWLFGFLGVLQARTRT